MSYSAITYNVMIASPGDVAAERAAVRQTLSDWNVVHSQTRQIVLLPVGWETHSSPQMGQHPQKILNKQMLERSDLLIGVFWTRLGTPTATHSSGSVEEIEEHLAAGKPVMLYFSNQPVRPDSVDPQQYRNLLAFKASCKERGLFEEYEDVAEFREKGHLIGVRPCLLPLLRLPLGRPRDTWQKTRPDPVDLVTFVRTRAGFLYVAVLLDLYARRIVGWAMRDRPDLVLVLGALNMALEQRRPARGLVHHTDQGSIYAARVYREAMHAHGIQPSMSAKGNAYDNAVAESFFSNLKNELVHHSDFRTHDEARAAIFEYMELFYNRRRRHQTLNYLSPVQFEQQWLVA